MTHLFIMGVLVAAQVPMALNLRFGDSESKGLTGLELQILRVSLSAGWRPASIPFEARIHSFDLGLTFYGKQWYESSYFISIARASQGIIYQKEINIYGFTTQYAVEPSYLFQVGYRANLGDIMEMPELTRRISIDTGIGWNFGKHGNMFAFEMLINVTLFKR